MKPSFLFRLLIALLFGPFLLTPTAQAQDQSPLTLRARAGFDGYCKENRWIPVFVTVENTGKDTQARIQASYSNLSNKQTTYAIDLLLPSGTRKEFFLYVFPENYVQKLTISVIVNQKTLAKHDLNINYLDEKNLLIGLLAESPSDYANLGELKPLEGMTRVVELRPADLPDQPQGWQPLNALVIAGADMAELTTAQRAALGAWLADGGKLLVTGGANWQNSAAKLIEFLPLKPEFTRRIETLDELRSYFRTNSAPTGSVTLSTGTLHPDAQVLVEQNGLPLLSRRVIGFGEVYYLAADPGLAPLKDWDGMETLYSHLLGANIPRPRWAGWPWDANATDNALTALPELGLPSVLLVCGWMGFYLLVIGPVNFLVLRHIKRLELAWLTIPALIVMFSAFAYVSGFLYRGTTPMLNRLLVVQGWDTAPLARANAIVGIYSPTRTRYDLESAWPFRFLPQGDGEGSLQSSGNWLALEQENGQFMPAVHLEAGGMKSVALEGSLPALNITHNLTVTVSNRQPELAGQITNHSALTLKNAFLVTPGSVTNLNDLKPGESRSIRVVLQVNRTQPGFYQMSSPALPVSYSLPSSEESQIIERRNALLRAAAMPQQYYSIPSNWGIYLMGWVETPLLSVGIRDVNLKNIDTSLVIQMLTPSFQFEGDAWKFNSALFAWEASQPEATPYSSGYGLINQGYVLRFRPAVPIQFSRVKSLTVTLNSSSLPNATTLEMWNYDLNLWSRVEVAAWGQIKIINPEHLVGPGGEVRLKLSADPSNWSEVYESSIDLVVKP